MNTLDLQTGSQNGTRLYAGGLVYQEQGEIQHSGDCLLTSLGVEHR